MPKINTLILNTILILLIFSSCGNKKTNNNIQNNQESSNIKEQQITKDAKRLIIIGFDGVDPNLVDKWAGEEILPNIKKLIKTGDYKHLQSVNPPQSPVAWTSFATGMYPGGHGIFDFLKRDPETYMPQIGTSEVFPRAIGPAKAISYRKGDSFWLTATQAGVKARVINVPFIFPPDPVKIGEMLSGLGVPDLRNTNSSFTLFGTDIPEEKVKGPQRGGVFIPVKLENGKAESWIEGMELPGEEGKIKLKISFTPILADKSIEIEFENGKKVKVRNGEGSSYIPVLLKSKSRSIPGIVRFRVIELNEQNFRIYMTPICYDPEEPFVPISYPKQYSGELAKLYGHYNTVGWEHDTSALSEGALDEDAFLQELYKVMEEREKIILSDLSRDGFDLFIGVFTAPDRVSHMFWRYMDKEHPLYDIEGGQKYGNAIRDVYVQMDKVIGKLMEKISSNDTLLIVSDHGFHSFRRGLHVNSWLLKQGYLVLKGGAQKTPSHYIMGLDDYQPFGVDWTKTHAYAIGTGQIYINLSDREKNGIVKSQDYENLVQEIKNKLLEVTDPAKGNIKIIKSVYTKQDKSFQGQMFNQMPDIQIAFADGYETSWETRTGAAPGGDLVVNNTDKWSGEHAANDVNDTDGIILSNKKISVSRPGIVDIAPTVLNFFNVNIPENYAGNSLW